STRTRLYNNAESGQARLTVTAASEAMYQAIQIQEITDAELKQLAKGSYLTLKVNGVAGMGDAACVLISMVMLIFYAGITGFSVSTTRAVIMYGLVLGARLMHRTYDLPTARSFAMILLLLENPMYLLYSGFQLSFLAVLGIHLVQGRGKLMSGVILMLVTLPVVLHCFYEIPLFGTFINLIVIPCLPLLLGLALFGLLLGGASAYPAVLLTRGLLMILNATAVIPFSSVILGRPGKFQTALYIIVLIMFLYLSGRAGTIRRRCTVSMLIPLMIYVLGFHARTDLEVHFLDVGQGDCIVIESDDGANIAVDGGSTSVSDVGSYRILPFLKSEGIRCLDYMVLTHMDEDHIGGMRQILEMIANRETSLRVDTVLLPYLADRDGTYTEMVRLAERAGARILFVSAGDSFAGGNLGITVLGPDPALEDRPVDPNAQCIVLAVSYKEFDCLLTGDVVGKGEENLTEILRQAGKQFEVLKVAHHGSKYSTPEEFLDIVWPEVSIISCGADNRYGHPHAALLRRLRGCGTRILRTDECGEIAVQTDGEYVRVKTYADG
ncbi:MAG: DNA internalization-related competence protein ComEC/Rec2, partial [Lachnospiraceae bacterium]|nr:DNA internalization-related competence protein ComEC/Rec2 [Lachnospiraceae bacterium]